MTAVEIIIFSVMFISHIIFLGIVLNNLTNAPRLNNKIKTKSEYSISVLIPARNEEKNVSRLLSDLSNQTYAIKEILVVDDNSSDRTAEIVQQFGKKNKIVKLISGRELPSGWLGKNWACHQLSLSASGEYLLFLDADVSLDNIAIEISINTLAKYEADMLSVFPTQKLKSLGEWLVIPLMNWLLLTFLPLKKVLTSRSKYFTAANGQFILIKKRTYEELGGHEAVKNEVVEDMEIARKAKLKAAKVVTCPGDNFIFAEMYNSFGGAFMGFSKNFYRGFGIGKFPFLILITILLILFWMPFILLLVNYIFILIVFIVALERVFVSILSSQNWFINLILHPVQIPVMFIIGCYSVFAKNITWKGRSI